MLAKEREEEKMSVGGVTLEELLQRLPSCVNRDLIDKAAIDFCYINTKGNRKKLVKVLLFLLICSICLFSLLTDRLFS